MLLKPQNNIVVCRVGCMSSEELPLLVPFPAVLILCTTVRSLSVQVAALEALGLASLRTSSMLADKIGCLLRLVQKEGQLSILAKWMHA